MIWGADLSAQVNNYVFAYFQTNGKGGIKLLVSEDGLVWHKANNGKPVIVPLENKVTRDPCIIRGDSLFHMVWTTSFSGESIGIGHATSSNLLNWSESEFIPLMQEFPDALNCWAPELYFDKENNEFIVYWSSTIPHKFPDTDKSGDKGYNHRIYYTTTNDFKTFTATKLLYEPGFNVIDATIQKINNEYWMFVKNETRTPTAKYLFIAKSEMIKGPYIKSTERITGRYWCEGPTVFVDNQSMTVYFDKYRLRKIGAIHSDDGDNWTEISGKVKIPRMVRHGTIMKLDSPIVFEDDDQ